MKPFFKSSAGTAFFTASAVACTLLFPCVEIYLRNRNFFSLSPWAALGFGLLSYLICCAGGFAVLFFLRNTRVFPATNAVFLGGGIAMLSQYLYWSEFFPERVLDDLLTPDMLILSGFHLFFLMLPLTVAFYFRRAFCRNAGKIALALALTQVVTIIVGCWNSTAQNYDFTEYSISEETKFEFARDENVIVLVVDAMGERICKEALEKYPELQTLFRDFICFDRMVSPIPRTMYAVPAILTGVEYPNQNGEADDGDHAEYLNRACRTEHSIFQALKKNGFRTEGYPFILQTISYSPDVIDNSTSITYQARKQSAIKILDAALNRQVPFFVKPLLEDYYYFATDQFVTPQDSSLRASPSEPFDITFYRRLNQEFRVGERDKVFKYLHLHGAHDAVRTDERLELNQETTKLRQLRGSLKIVELLFEKLKAADLYDNATIVVIGDHTEFYTPETVAFIKRKNAKSHALCYNSIPCKVSDIAATVLKESSVLTELKSLFDVPPIWGDGVCRESCQIQNMLFSAWKKIRPVQTEDFTLYSKSFHQENNKLIIEPDLKISNQTLKISLLLKNTATGDCWESKSLPADDTCRFLETPPLIFPDGVYQIFLMEQTTDENSVCDMQSLPEFLVISDGQYQWTQEYPNQVPCSMHIGEEIVFRPMRPYPQMEFCDGTSFRDDAVVLGKKGCLGVRLPKLSAPAQLTLVIKYPLLPAGTLILHEGDTLLAEVPIKQPQDLTIPVILSSGRERTMTLRFSFIPKRRNRETMPLHLRIYLRSIKLQTLKS